MKMLMKTALAVGCLAELAHADILRLRNGEVIEGKFISGSDAGIWFEKLPREASVYPLTLVESVAFGSGFLTKQDSPPVIPAKSETSRSENQAPAHSRIATGR